MNENGMKKREWVKTAAIIFLAVLLVLTFFSNTIMNYSLPEVAAQYVQSGTITAKIRGTGVVESGSLTEVKTKMIDRTIASVNVRVGDKVQEGDVLFELKDSEESEALTDAKRAVEDAEIAYEKAIRKLQAEFLKGGLSEEIYHNIQAGVTTSYTEYYKRIMDAEAKVDEYKKRADEITNKINELTVKKESLQYDEADTTKEAREYHEAQLAYDSKNSELTTVKGDLQEKKEALYEAEKLIRDYNAGLTVSGGNSQQQIADALEKIDKLPGLIMTIESDVSRLEQEAYNAKTELDKKKAALDSKSNNTGSINALAKEIENWTKEQTANDERLKEAQKVWDDVANEINIELGGGDAAYDIETPKKDLENKREELAKMEKEMLGGTIDAPVAGTIVSISRKAGEKTSDTSGSVVLATIQPEGKGFTMSFSVTNEQAKRLSVGDKADIVNSWRYDDVEVTLASIKPDTVDPGRKKLLSFDVSGEVTAGQSLNISVGQKSANYDLIVPNSAIREDNNGKFILIVESKSSPLGNRYYARRVDVEVLASDDTQSAVSGGLYGYEFVITTSTAPVEAGKLVRLAEG